MHGTVVLSPDKAYSVGKSSFFKNYRTDTIHRSDIDLFGIRRLTSRWISHYPADKFFHAPTWSVDSERKFIRWIGPYPSMHRVSSQLAPDHFKTSITQSYDHMTWSFFVV